MTETALGVIADDGTMAVDVGIEGRVAQIALSELNDDLPVVMEDEVVRYLVYIGLKNVLQDSHASIKRADFDSDDAWKDAKLGRALKKLDALYAGEVRMVAAASGSKGDEVKARAMVIIEGHVKSEWRKANKKLDAKAIEDEKKKRYAAKTALWRDLAAVQLRREAEELAEIEKRMAGEDLTMGRP